MRLGVTEAAMHKTLPSGMLSNPVNVDRGFVQHHKNNLLAGAME